MITDQKEINKHFKDALKSFKMGIELAKKNMIIGEIRFPTITKMRKVRNEREKLEPSEIMVLDKPRKIRKRRTPKEKGLPDLDKDGYMKGRPPTTEE